MELVVRATVIYFFLWLVTRGVGKRELSEMTAFELILLVVMGDLIQQGVTQEDLSVTGAMMAVATIAFWIVVFSYLTYKFKGAESVLEGLPVVVLRDGEPLMEALAIERVTLEELKEEARDQGLEDLAQVRLGVLEPDGKFSFIKRGGEQHREQEKHEA
jgi:uncharacterized membrane protein YcaP (DUF421 family)